MKIKIQFMYMYLITTMEPLFFSSIRILFILSGKRLITLLLNMKAIMKPKYQDKHLNLLI